MEVPLQTMAQAIEARRLATLWVSDSERRSQSREALAAAGAFDKRARFADQSVGGDPIMPLIALA